MDLTEVIEPEGDGFVALYPALDIASQGDTIESAQANLREALELFFECADSDEIQRRSRNSALLMGLDGLENGPESSAPESSAKRTGETPS